MQVKKIVLTILIATFMTGISAQNLNVQSAIQDLKKNYLNKAKEEIDAATLHESTKNDAKTWLYKGLIYTRIGGETTKAKSKFKTLAPDWAEQAYQAALECKRLDEKKEWVDQNNSVFSYVGNEFYNKASKAYNDHDFASAMAYADKSIECFTNTGHKNYAEDSRWIAGLSARASQDNEAMKKYLNQMVRTKTKRNLVYRILFDTYKREDNKEKAMQIANSYMKNCPTDYNAPLLMAEAYLLTDNVDKGNEMIEKALEMTKDSATIYPQILSLSAAILENIQDYDGAEKKYNESLTLKPQQFDANFGMGKMIFNRAVDRLDAAGAVPIDDETGLYDKYLEEANNYFSKSAIYFNAAIEYIDNLSDEKAKAGQKANLFNCLNALKTVYARLEKYDDLKNVNARLEEIQKAQ